MIGRFNTASRETCLPARGQAGVRASIVALKRGNARGAKGCRKMESLPRGRLNGHHRHYLWVSTDGESLRHEGTTGYRDATIADGHRPGGSLAGPSRSVVRPL